MSGPKPKRSLRERLTGLFGGVLAACLVAVACTGENIFPTGVVGGGGDASGDSVAITAPDDGASVPVSDSVAVTVAFASESGVNAINFRHDYPGGNFTRAVTLGAPAQDTTITRNLWTGTSTGSGTIVVQTTDVLGSTIADTISVTIN